MSDVVEEVVEEELEFVEEPARQDGMSLYVQQLDDVSAMRSTLLAMDRRDPNNVRIALQNITVMRVYHQIARIIRFTELMDKLEDKMYDSIECSLQSMDSMDMSTWMQLCNLQEKLQRTMVDSHKLLEPYLNFEALTTLETPQQADPADTFAAKILDQESRERLRTASQQALAAIQQQQEAEKAQKAEEQQATEQTPSQEDPKEVSPEEVPADPVDENKLKAQQALAAIAGEQIQTIA